MSQCQGVVKHIEFFRDEIVAKLQAKLPELRKHVMEWHESASLILVFACLIVIAMQTILHLLARNQDYQLTQAMLDLVELKATSEPVTIGGRTLGYRKQYTKKGTG